MYYLLSIQVRVGNRKWDEILILRNANSKERWVEPYDALGHVTTLATNAIAYAYTGEEKMTEFTPRQSRLLSHLLPTHCPFCSQLDMRYWHNRNPQACSRTTDLFPRTWVPLPSTRLYLYIQKLSNLINITQSVWWNDRSPGLVTHGFSQRQLTKYKVRQFPARTQMTLVNLLLI